MTSCFPIDFYKINRYNQSENKGLGQGDGTRRQEEKMDRSVMINEVVAIEGELGMTEEFQTQLRSKLKKYDTRRLEKEHIKATKAYEEERERLAQPFNCPPEPKENQKENEMAKKSEKTKVADPVVETIESKALKALFFTVLAKEDRPDTTDWTDAQVEEELKENIELLSPGDMETVKGMEDGEAIWEYFVSLFPALAPKQTAPKEKKSKESSEPPVEKKIPNSTKFVHIICDEFVATDDKIVPADVKKKFADGGGKLSESMQDAWIADALKILRYLRATDRLK